ncbi:hypothetical protein AB0D13_41155 [Streptomyces sp. NPDC048430]|uniref:hypothetical protein n=1 Tax=Streptomyces sp. NPDC048430 TaxID=3155388 RepID=UPI00342AE2A6
MALLSRTVVSLGRPFEDGELIAKTTPPDDLHTRLLPTTSTSTPKRGHATPADQRLQDGAATMDRRYWQAVASGDCAPPYARWRFWLG